MLDRRQIRSRISKGRDRKVFLPILPSFLEWLSITTVGRNPHPFPDVHAFHVLQHRPHGQGSSSADSKPGIPKHLCTYSKPGERACRDICRVGDISSLPILLLIVLSSPKFLRTHLPEWLLNNGESGILSASITDLIYVIYIAPK